MYAALSSLEGKQPGGVLFQKQQQIIGVLYTEMALTQIDYRLPNPFHSDLEIPGMKGFSFLKAVSIFQKLGG